MVFSLRLLCEMCRLLVLGGEGRLRIPPLRQSHFLVWGWWTFWIGYNGQRMWDEEEEVEEIGSSLD